MSLLDFSDPHLIASSQNFWFHGITLASVVYGGNLTLFILSLSLLLCRVSSGRSGAGADGVRHRWSIFSLCYTILIFGLATVSIVLEIIVEERAFTQPWMVPGAGPSYYLFNNVFGNVTILQPVYVILISCHFFSTSLLAWRCLILYQASLTGFFFMHTRVPMWVVVMVWPSCLLGASISTGIIFVIDALAPQKLPSVLSGLPWIIIWGGIAVILLWTLTGLLVLRLLTCYWNTRKALKDQRHVKYKRLIGIFIESAGPLTIFWVFFVVVFFLKSPALAMLPFLLTQVQVLSSLLIIYQITTCEDTWSRSVIETLPMPAFADTPSEPSGVLTGLEVGCVVEETQTRCVEDDANTPTAEGFGIQ